MNDFIINALPHLLNKEKKPLSKASVKTYVNYFENFKQENLFNCSITIFSDPENGPKIIRQYLSKWLQNIPTWNNRKSCLSRFFDYVIDLGLIQRNPCQPLKTKTKNNDDTYMEDNHYLAITDQITLDQKSEVYARACDWIYLVSGRVDDMLDVKLDQIIGDEIHYSASKNGETVILEIDEELRKLINWFKHYRNSQVLHGKTFSVTTPYLIFHPVTKKRKMALKEISGDNLYQYFKKAAKKLNLNHYHLRHLRAKALTDEAIIAGHATNKGAHKSESMRKLYVKKKIPVRLKNNIKRIR